MAELELRDQLAMSWVEQDQQYRQWQAQRGLTINTVEEAEKHGQRVGERAYKFADAVLAARTPVTVPVIKETEACRYQRGYKKCALPWGHPGNHWDNRNGCVQYSS